MPVRDGEESKAVANEFGMPSNGLHKKLIRSIYSEEIKNFVVLQDLTVCIILQEKLRIGVAFF